MTTASLDAGTLGPNNSEEKIVGPFTWTPIVNALGHDCLLMIASAVGDASNVDDFRAGETMEEWRLVPNDNNIGQRNVYPVPGKSGATGLADVLNGMRFTVGNPNPKRAAMSLKAAIPPELVQRGWSVAFRGLPDALKSGEKADVTLDVTKGRDFTPDDVRQMRDPSLVVEAFADGLLVGGVTYAIDPAIGTKRRAARH